ncbi:6-bladed beta-propeller [Aliifodinibius salicampi]|uniref:6-bladed beta-propeller n=1 Tax=Fodinibius salicampi TaxID=1920655 RepID=A0ABT3PWK8_9BACT|nr:6-bladed beta-propeller [Fodinibius salicampi]MCW9712237.1 6-bladed beta-propeller [Fodinibius salicampi]
MRSSTLILLLSVFFLSCSGEKSGERSPSTNQREASTTAEDTSQVREPVATEDSSKPAADSKLTPEIQFEREQRFGSTDEVVVGTIETFTVDDSGRVFIADRDQTTIHVYNPDGSYNTSLGREGKGPGEFSGIGSIKIHAGMLYAADRSPFPLRVHAYSLDSWEFSHTIPLWSNNRGAFEELNGKYPSQFYPRDDESFLVSYSRPGTDYLDEESFLHYYMQDENGEIISDKIFEQKDLRYLVYKYPDGYTVAYTFPFLEKSLFAISKDGLLYSARSKEFLIKVYNRNGKYLREIQHPFNQTELNQSELVVNTENKVRRKMINQHELPEDWPALETMFFYDENRLWVSTIVEDNEVYEWWILEDTGEVITKFEWPRDHPIEEVRNDKLYARETEDETGLEKIVRYDIVMTEQR